MDFLFQAYDTFISNFPAEYQGLISFGILAIVIIMLFHLVKKNILWILLLVIFIPASIPVLQKVGEGIILFLKYIVSKV